MSTTKTNILNPLVGNSLSLPDLYISSVTTPTSVIEGNNLSFSYKIKDQGTASAGASVTNFYLSTSPTLNSSAIALGSNNVSTLSSGTSKTQSVTLATPNNVTPGTYYLLAQANGTNTVVESNTNNNLTSSQAITIQGQPDLTISNFTAPNSANVGNPFTINYTINNQGTKVASAGASVTNFFLSTSPTLNSSAIALGSNNVYTISGGTSKTQSVTLATPNNVTPGTYYLLAQANGTNTVVESNTNNNLTSSQAITIQPTNQIITQNGSPFFPLGFYYIDYTSSTEQAVLQGQQQALTNIAGAGFNTVQMSVQGYNTEFQTLLTQAQSLGVNLIASDIGNNSSQVASTVAAIKNNSSLLGYTIGDDVNSNTTPTALAQIDAQIKTLDPNHGTYITQYSETPSVINTYTHVANYMGQEIYPINYSTVNEAGYSIGQATSASGSTQGSPVIANLQTFAWSNDRMPTTAEVRNMTYQALLEGAKGIMYYTYKDSSNFLPNDTALWSGMKTIAQEVTSLEPYILASNLLSTNLTQSNSQLLCDTWQVGNQKLLFVLNTSTQSQNLSLNLPASTTQASSFLNTETPTLSVTNGALQGSLAPLDVQVYQIF